MKSIRYSVYLVPFVCLISSFDTAVGIFTYYQGCSIFTVRTDVESITNTSRALPHVLQLEECMRRCLAYDKCVAFDYHAIRRPRKPHCRLQLDPVYLTQRIPSPDSDQWELTSRCAIALNDLDDCRSDPCQNHASCEDTPNSFICHCQPHYGGTLCEAHLACDSAPCLNGGTCIPLDRGRYKCNCTEYMYDPHKSCQGSRPCDSNPCQRGGNCSEVKYNDLFGYECECGASFGGWDCQKNVSISDTGGIRSEESGISASVWVVTTLGIILMIIAALLAIYACKQYRDSSKTNDVDDDEDSVSHKMTWKSLRGSALRKM